jgi:hypothetical protein
MSTASQEDDDSYSIDSACLRDFLDDFGGDVPVINAFAEQADAEDADAALTTTLLSDSHTNFEDDTSPEMLKARLSQFLRCSSGDGSEANRRWLCQLGRRVEHGDLVLASTLKFCGIALLCRIADSIPKLSSEASGLCEAVLTAPDSQACLGVNDYTFQVITSDTSMDVPVLDDVLQLDPVSLKLRPAELLSASQQYAEPIILQTAPLHDRAVIAEKMIRITSLCQLRLPIRGCGAAVSS